MLGKLFKLEIKATGRILLPLYAVLIAFSLINLLFSQFGQSMLDIPMQITMLVVGVAMIAVFVMTFILMLQRFSNSLLSDEGYLMFTLPLNPWKHIVSKLLVSIMWIVISGVTTFIAILIISFKEGSIEQMFEAFSMLFNQAINEFGSQAFLIGFEVLLAGFAYTATIILLIYASIGVGHLFNNHRVMASFGAFIIFNILSQTIVSIFITIFGSVFPFFKSPNIMMGSFGEVHLVLSLIILCNLLFGTIYFIITNYVLCNRLNLE